MIFAIFSISVLVRSECKGKQSVREAISEARVGLFLNYY